jgi:hypothetical protein
MSLANIRALGVLVAAVSLSLLGTRPVSAALGSDSASVDRDSARMRAQHIATPMLQYERHDITAGMGGAVTEFVSRSGKVFAVTWHAQLPPDLSALFGSYYDSYRAAVAAQSAPGNHRHVAVVQPDLVVSAFGRVGTFTGVAYVPSLVPVGFDLADLR